MIAVAKPTLSKRERTRLAIINSAIEIIADKGLDGSSIDELMAKADMARGTFYNYFQTREEVLDAVIAHLRIHLHEAIEQHIPENLPSESVVACMVFGFYHYAIKNPCFGRVLTRLNADINWFASYDPADQHFPRADAAIIDLIHDNTDFLTAMTYVEGITNNFIRKTLQNQLQTDSIHQMTNMLLKGLSAKQKQINAALKTAQSFVEELEFAYSE